MMKTTMCRLFLLLFAAALLLAGCAAGNASVSQPTESTPTGSNAEQSDVSRGNALSLSGDLMQLVSARAVEGKAVDEAFRLSQAELAVKLLGSAVENSEGKNILISPLSVQVALAMTANGADGQTLSEMETLLGGDLPLGTLNEYLHGYIGALPSTEKCKVTLANSIWFRKSESFTVYEDFLQTNADYYDAQMYAEPFDDSTVALINNWVKTNTDGMIEEVIDRIDADTMMYLINALTFDGAWAEPYGDPYDGTFNNADGTQSTVKMMGSEESYWFETDSAVGFAKPYEGDQYRFVAILPKEGVDPDAYLRSLTAQDLLDITDGMQSGSVSATMPKFSYEYSWLMNEQLKQLGMPSAFASGAEFGRMSNEKLYIGMVLHKTFIEVAEQGTRAGAVTVVRMDAECCPVYDQIIRLDRPFAYMIVDTQNGLPLFVGAVTNLG